MAKSLHNGPDRRHLLLTAAGLAGASMANGMANAAEAQTPSGAATQPAPDPATGPATGPAGQTLASWNDGPAKQSILDFVHATTDPSSRDFVAPEDRIATFDQDGTLWVEHPLYTQAMFALSRVHQLAPRHPEWAGVEPFRAVLSGDPRALGTFTERDWFAIVAATHAGMSTSAFAPLVAAWLAQAKDRRFKRPFTELTYQPMQEVMALLRANGFKTYIVTGGGQDFVRVFAQRVYAIPPEQVVGSVDATQYQMQDGAPILMRLPKVAFVNDGAGKPVGIERVIGKRPIAAFGNSDGDREMLQWTATGPGARLAMLVHHDDAQREYAYGPGGGLPDTKVGRFSDSLMSTAKTAGWTVISMKNDWRRIFAFEAA